MTSLLWSVVDNPVWDEHTFTLISPKSGKIGPPPPNVFLFCWPGQRVTSEMHVSEIVPSEGKDG